MANCSNCSAPLPPHSIVCEYCGSRNDVDLRGVHRYTTHETESRRACPRCGIPLRTIDLRIGGKFLMERCDQCLGLFFDPGELEALLDATVEKVFVIDRQRLDAITDAARPGGEPIRYLKCPVCSKLMNRVNFGAKSGVIVDRCRDHGVWLDGGELRRLLEWVKAGGRLLDGERREQRLKEREEQDRSSKALDPAMGKGELPLGGDLRHSHSDLLDLLAGLFRHVLG